jgi:hypothetical protein
MKCAVCGRTIAGFKPYLGQTRAFHARCYVRLISKR